MSKERGLWVGLPIPKLPESNMITQYMPSDAHVTLLHLGKTDSRDKVDRAFWAITNECKAPGSRSAEITGVGWFWRNVNQPVPVALVNSAFLFEVRARICVALDSAKIEYDKRFGFIPHVTLNKELASPVVLGMNYGSNTGPRFQFQQVELVWGDNALVLS